MEQIVIEEIKKLFKKKRNTLYSVRIVYIVYTDTINVFFEEQKIGESTYYIKMIIVKQILICN